MRCNVGGIERAIRILVGILFVGLGALAGLPAGLTMTLYAAGAIALATGAIGFCPVWSLLGINTCEPNTTGKA